MGPRQIIGEPSSTMKPMDITFSPQASSGRQLAVLEHRLARRCPASWARRGRRRRRRAGRRAGRARRRRRPGSPPRSTCPPRPCRWPRRSPAPHGPAARPAACRGRPWGRLRRRAPLRTRVTPRRRRLGRPRSAPPGPFRRPGTAREGGLGGVAHRRVEGGVLGGHLQHEAGAALAQDQPLHQAGRGEALRPLLGRRPDPGPPGPARSGWAEGSSLDYCFAGRGVSYPGPGAALQAPRAAPDQKKEKDRPGSCPGTTTPIPAPGARRRRATTAAGSRDRPAAPRWRRRPAPPPPGCPDLNAGFDGGRRAEPPVRRPRRPGVCGPGAVAAVAGGGLRALGAFRRLHGPGQPGGGGHPLRRLRPLGGAGPALSPAHSHRARGAGFGDQPEQDRIGGAPAPTCPRKA